MPIGFPNVAGGGLGFAEWINRPLDLWAWMNLPALGASNNLQSTFNMIVGSPNGVGNDFIATRHVNSVEIRKYDFAEGRFVWGTPIPEATAGLYINGGNRIRTNAGTYILPFQSVSGQLPRAARVAADGSYTVINFPDGTLNTFPKMFYIPEIDTVIANVQATGGGGWRWYSSFNDGVTWYPVNSTITGLIGIFWAGTGDTWQGLRNNGTGGLEIIYSNDYGLSWTAPVLVATGVSSLVYATKNQDSNIALAAGASNGLMRVDMTAETAAFVAPANEAAAEFPSARQYNAPRYHAPSSQWICMMNSRQPCVSADDGLTWRLGHLIIGFSDEPFAGPAIGNDYAGEFYYSANGQCIFFSKDHNNRPVINLV